MLFNFDNNQTSQIVLNDDNPTAHDSAGDHVQYVYGLELASNPFRRTIEEIPRWRASGLLFDIFYRPKDDVTSYIDSFACESPLLDMLVISLTNAD